MRTVYNTKGIVLRTTKYSETSIICRIYTERFGTQNYIINGIRTSKTSGKNAAFFHPSALLNLIVYHNEFKKLHRIKEFKWDYIYKKIFSTVSRNAIALFIVDIMTRTLRSPDQNHTLYQFTEKTLICLDTTLNKKIYANLPIYYTTQLIQMLGFRIDINELTKWPHPPQKTLYQILLHFIETQHIEDIQYINTSREERQSIIEILLEYYQTHIHNFGNTKTYHILKEILL